MSIWLPIEKAPKSRDTLVDLWVISATSRQYQWDKTMGRYSPTGEYTTREYRVTDCYWGGNGYSWVQQNGKSVTGRYYYDQVGDDSFDPLCIELGPRTCIAKYWMFPPAPPESVDIQASDG